MREKEEEAGRVREKEGGVGRGKGLPILCAVHGNHLWRVLDLSLRYVLLDQPLEALGVLLLNG